MSGIKEASVMLGMNEQTVRLLMDEGALDIGYVIWREHGRNTYIVVPELLEKEVKRLGKTHGV